MIRTIKKAIQRNISTFLTTLASEKVATSIRLINTNSYYIYIL